MKNSNSCLFLNGVKAYNIRQLRENFDTDIIVGYLLGGGLTQWLFEIGETEILKRVREIDLAGGDFDRKLEFIFGVKPDPKPQKIVFPNIPREVRLAVFAAKENGFDVGDTSSYKKPESVTSFSGSAGSFVRGSFSSGSFRLVKTSFFFGSGGLSGSFRPTSGGSFSFFMGKTQLTAEEYQRTKINLSSCPLNEYGYGIHRI